MGYTFVSTPNLELAVEVFGLALRGPFLSLTSR